MISSGSTLERDLPNAATERPDLSSLSRRELRKIAQPPEFSPSPTDQVYRVASIYFSIPLARLGASPNGITVGWILAGLAGALCLLAPLRSIQLAGAVLLEVSYLFDFVDGEVARLTRRSSKIGEFLDLMGHTLIKTALPLAVAGSVFVRSGSGLMLVAGAIGAVAIGVGDSLRFHAACTARQLAAGDIDRAPSDQPRRRNFSPVKVLGALFELSYESPGLFGLVLVAASLGCLWVLALYWMITGPVWMCLRASNFARRLQALPGQAA